MHVFVVALSLLARTSLSIGSCLYCYLVGIPSIGQKRQEMLHGVNSHVVDVCFVFVREHVRGVLYCRPAGLSVFVCLVEALP